MRQQTSEGYKASTLKEMQVAGVPSLVIVRLAEDDVGSELLDYFASNWSMFETKDFDEIIEKANTEGIVAVLVFAKNEYEIDLSLNELMEETKIPP